VKRVKNVRVVNDEVEVAIQWKDSSVPVRDVDHDLIKAYLSELAVSNAAKLIQLAEHDEHCRRIMEEIRANLAAAVNGGNTEMEDAEMDDAETENEGSDVAGPSGPFVGDVTMEEAPDLNTDNVQTDCEEDNKVEHSGDNESQGVGQGSGTHKIGHVQGVENEYGVAEKRLDAEDSEGAGVKEAEKAEKDGDAEAAEPAHSKQPEHTEKHSDAARSPNVHVEGSEGADDHTGDPQPAHDEQAEHTEKHSGAEGSESTHVDPAMDVEKDGHSGDSRLVHDEHPEHTEKDSDAARSPDVPVDHGGDKGSESTPVDNQGLEDVDTIPSASVQVEHLGASPEEEDNHDDGTTEDAFDSHDNSTIEVAFDNHDNGTMPEDAFSEAFAALQGEHAGDNDVAEASGDAGIENPGNTPDTAWEYYNAVEAPGVDLDAQNLHVYDDGLGGFSNYQH